METSDQVDRERRLNERKKVSWARRFIRPRTLRVVFGTGAAILRALWWLCKVIDYFRE
ncbi:hypothetical protein SAMN05216566_12826 [Aureimonas phyllosphaerae]|nr:hypothetical protein SAMN05216566_12826 [Aureimonas phyllosphaerae]